MNSAPYFLCCEDISFFTLLGKDAKEFVSSLSSASLPENTQEAFLSAILTPKGRLQFVFYVALCSSSEDGVLLLVAKRNLHSLLSYLHEMHFSEQIEIPSIENTSSALPFAHAGFGQQQVFVLTAGANLLAENETALALASALQNSLPAHMANASSFVASFFVAGEAAHHPLQFFLFKEDPGEDFLKRSLKKVIQKKNELPKLPKGWAENLSRAGDGKNWQDICYEASFPLAEFLTLKDVPIMQQSLISAAIARGKGCYPGQEVVERQLSQGKVPLHMVVALLCDISAADFFSLLQQGEGGIPSMQSGGVLPVEIAIGVASEFDEKKIEMVGDIFAAGIIALRCVLLVKISSRFASHEMQWVAKLFFPAEHSAAEIFFPVTVCHLPLITAGRIFTTETAMVLSTSHRKALEAFHNGEFTAVRNIIFLALQTFFSLPASKLSTKNNSKAATKADANKNMPIEALLRERIAAQTSPLASLLKLVELMAVCFEKLQQEQTAILWNKLLATAAPQEVMPHTNLSRLYMQAGLIELAEKEKAKATMLGFKQEAATREMQHAQKNYEQQKNIADEMRAQKLQAILQQFPNDEIALFALGKIFFEKKEYKKALPYLEKLCTGESSSSAGFMIYAKTLLALQMRLKAKEILLRGIAVANVNGDFMPLKVMQVDLNNLA